MSSLSKDQERSLALKYSCKKTLYDHAVKSQCEVWNATLCFHTVLSEPPMYTKPTRLDLLFAQFKNPHAIAILIWLSG